MEVAIVQCSGEGLDPRPSLGPSKPNAKQRNTKLRMKIVDTRMNYEYYTIYFLLGLVSILRLTLSAIGYHAVSEKLPYGLVRQAFSGPCCFQLQNH